MQDDKMSEEPSSPRESKNHYEPNSLLHSFSRQIFDNCSLKWKGFEDDICSGLAHLYCTEDLADVTIACEGRLFKGHKAILAMCSPFFRKIFIDTPSKHPVVIVKGIKPQDLQRVLQFVYFGEVRMDNDEIDDFLEAAESLNVEGLTSDKIQTSYYNKKTGKESVQEDELLNEKRGEATGTESSSVSIGGGDVEMTPSSVPSSVCSDKAESSPERIPNRQLRRHKKFSWSPSSVEVQDYSDCSRSKSSNDMSQVAPRPSSDSRLFIKKRFYSGENVSSHHSSGKNALSSLDFSSGKKINKTNLFCISDDNEVQGTGKKLPSGAKDMTQGSRKIENGGKDSADASAYERPRNSDNSSCSEIVSSSIKAPYCQDSEPLSVHVNDRQNSYPSSTTELGAGNSVPKSEEGAQMPESTNKQKESRSPVDPETTCCRSTKLQDTYTKLSFGSQYLSNSPTNSKIQSTSPKHVSNSKDCLQHKLKFWKEKAEKESGIEPAPQESTSSKPIVSTSGPYSPPTSSNLNNVGGNMTSSSLEKSQSCPSFDHDHVMNLSSCTGPVHTMTLKHPQNLFLQPPQEPLVVDTDPQDLKSPDTLMTLRAKLASGHYPYHSQRFRQSCQANVALEPYALQSTPHPAFSANFLANGSEDMGHMNENLYNNITSPKSHHPKPKTKAIRSSQVPPSARYTAHQVDQMVDQVQHFPGNLVPCAVCKKFVKRERLRAHIHECHLLYGEKIICPHCGIGLKSKGSFRVHIWRHKRGTLSSRPRQ